MVKLMLDDFGYKTLIALLLFLPADIPVVYFYPLVTAYWTDTCKTQTAFLSVIGFGLYPYQLRVEHNLRLVAWLADSWQGGGW